MPPRQAFICWSFRRFIIPCAHMRHAWMRPESIFLMAPVTPVSFLSVCERVSYATLCFVTLAHNREQGRTCCRSRCHRQNLQTYFTYENGGEGNRTPVLVAFDANIYMFSRRGF